MYINIWATYLKKSKIHVGAVKLMIRFFVNIYNKGDYSQTLNEQPTYNYILDVLFYIVYKILQQNV